jgi:polysaccharide deacetylase family protein (PEP-CTERM system associated)
MLNAISVDVEEYFHAANLETVVGPAQWWRQESRVEASTDIVLELFSRLGIRGTFFVLGHSARRHPQMVKKIAVAGHEIASHGYGHRLAYTQQQKQFFRDVHRTKRLLEDLTGNEVIGYRAPNFSITDKNPWAYDTLIEAGYRYDSSRYPIYHPRYANQRKPRTPEKLECRGGSIYVLPLATTELSLLGRVLRIPLGGGAYWRLLPRSVMNWGLQRIIEKEKQWFTCYIHPWELDPLQPVFNELSPLTKLRHYGGITGFERTLEHFFNQFSFGPLREAAEQTFGANAFAKSSTQAG